MRAAPPISVVIEPRAPWTAGSCALVGAAAAAPTAWTVAWLEGAVGLQAGAALLAGVLTALVVWRALARRDEQRLLWNGREWLLDGAAGGVQAVADLGGWMLLRHDAAIGRRRWIGVARASHAAEWHGLRCAVHARRPSTATSGASA